MEQPELKEIANEPFAETIGGKPFTFRNIGMGRALSTISSWILKTRREEIRSNASVFEDDKARVAYVREELEKLPKGNKLASAALEALCGDQKFIDSKGEEGVGPTIDEDLMRDLIRQGLKGGKVDELNDALDTLSQQAIVFLSLRVMGIKTERDAVVTEAGGDAPKKVS